VSEDWREVRYVQQDQTCCFCFARIPRSAPGSKRGTRGTKAWILFGARLTCARTGRTLLGPPLWECIPCHDELTRAQLAGGA
jgi:hypothetical protein